MDATLWNKINQNAETAEEFKRIVASEVKKFIKKTASTSAKKPITKKKKSK